VLRFYAQYQGENGSLGHMPWWNFVDWAHEWPNGEPPAEADGSGSAALNLQLVLAYQWAAELENKLGDEPVGALYAKRARELAETVRKADWDSGRGLFADQPSHRTYSQHVNTLAVLAHIASGAEARGIVEKIFADNSLTQSSIYFRAYTNAALREVGLGNRYLEVLGPWREMLASGLTTWAEWNGPDVRSDCHAWGASPNFELLRTVAGIEPIGPGFSKVRIAPNLGSLPTVQARMPHPKGEIAVDFAVHDGRLTGSVELPPETSGVLEWHGHKQKLHPGVNRIVR
jgi:alpha-L-rhamnosidase